MKKEKIGISLIVLIITIIVMLILAGTAIVSLGNNGIIDRANEAVDKINEREVQEVANLAWAEAYAAGKKTKKDLQTAVEAALESNNIDLKDYVITVTTSGVTVSSKKSILESWKANVVDIVDGVPIPKGFVASSATGENRKDIGLVIYEGEEQVTDTNVDLARRSRNQYVWVPVDNMSKFKRQSFGETYNISETIGTGYWEITPTTTLNTVYMTEEDLNEVKAMYASVEKYGGFYVARYEAGLDSERTSNTPFITGSNVKFQMNKYIYYIAFANDVTLGKGGALEIARSIYSNDSGNTTGVVSTLMYGVQWDTTFNWLLDTKAVESVTANKADYGNFRTHIINNVAEEVNEGAKYKSDNEPYQSLTVKTENDMWCMTTGALKVAATNNIYDLAGNAWEWTMEGKDEWRLLSSYYERS